MKLIFSFAAIPADSVDLPRWRISPRGTMKRRQCKWPKTSAAFVPSVGQNRACFEAILPLVFLLPNTTNSSFLHLSSFSEPYHMLENGYQWMVTPWRRIEKTSARASAFGGLVYRLLSRTDRGRTNWQLSIFTKRRPRIQCGGVFNTRLHLLGDLLFWTFLKVTSNHDFRQFEGAKEDTLSADLNTAGVTFCQMDLYFNHSSTCCHSHYSLSSPSPPPCSAEWHSAVLSHQYVWLLSRWYTQHYRSQVQVQTNQAQFWSCLGKLFPILLLDSKMIYWNI